MPFALYSEGQYFGDTEVITEYGRQGRDGIAIAVTECHIQVIGKVKLLTVLKRFKSVKDEMEKIAFGRLQYHKESK